MLSKTDRVCIYFPGLLEASHLASKCLFTSNRVGHNEVIGVCRTGPDAEGLGRDHWNEMLAYPRKPITHWHALGEVLAPFYQKLLKMSLNPALPCGAASFTCFMEIKTLSIVMLTVSPS